MLSVSTVRRILFLCAGIGAAHVPARAQAPDPILVYDGIRVYPLADGWCAAGTAALRVALPVGADFDFRPSSPRLAEILSDLPARIQPSCDATSLTVALSSVGSPLTGPQVDQAAAPAWRAYAHPQLGHPVTIVMLRVARDGVATVGSVTEVFAGATTIAGIEQRVTAAADANRVATNAFEEQLRAQQLAVERAAAERERRRLAQAEAIRAEQARREALAESRRAEAEARRAAQPPPAPIPPEPNRAATPASDALTARGAAFLPASPVHHAGEAIVTGDGYAVYASTRRLNRAAWCWKGDAQIAYVLDADTMTAIRLDEDFRHDFETTVVPAVHRLCPRGNITALFYTKDFQLGVDGSIQPVGRLAVPEVAIDTVVHLADGRYFAKSTDGRELRHGSAVPRMQTVALGIRLRSDEDRTAILQRAMLQEVQLRALARARTAPARIDLEGTSSENRGFWNTLYEGRSPMATAQGTRLLYLQADIAVTFTMYHSAFGEICPLVEPAQTIRHYVTTTTYEGWTPVSQQTAETGEATIRERFAAAYRTAYDQGTNPVAFAMNPGGMDAVMEMLLNLGKRGEDARELFERHGCYSPTISLLEENLHRAAGERPSWQTEMAEYEQAIARARTTPAVTGTAVGASVRAAYGATGARPPPAATDDGRPSYDRSAVTPYADVPSNDPRLAQFPEPYRVTRFVYLVDPDGTANDSVTVESGEIYYVPQTLGDQEFNLRTTRLVLRCVDRTHRMVSTTITYQNAATAETTFRSADFRPVPDGTPLHLLYEVLCGDDRPASRSQRTGRPSPPAPRTESGGCAIGCAGNRWAPENMRTPSPSAIQRL